MTTLILCLILQEGVVAEMGQVSFKLNRTEVTEFTTVEKMKHRRLLQMLTGGTIRYAMV